MIIHYAKRGFSLIELAIVMIIIGLISGSVFWGMQLVRESELRSLISDLERFQKAIGMFKDKYNQLPGDMYNATGFWGADAPCPLTTWNTVRKKATCNGDGNGKISPRNYDTASYADFRETFRAWQQLSNAGFIDSALSAAAGPSGTGLDTRVDMNVPASKASNAGYMLYHLTCLGCGSYYNLDYRHVIQVGLVGTSPNDYAHRPFLEPAEALSIDVKIDDGRPSYGKMVVPSTETSCVTSAVQVSAQYNATNQARPLCSLILITGH
jgi:prepilin-type N-terminal cleavage/methylation domain-containing protein